LVRWLIRPVIQGLTSTPNEGRARNSRCTDQDGSVIGETKTRTGAQAAGSARRHYERLMTPTSATGPGDEGNRRTPSRWFHPVITKGKTGTRPTTAIRGPPSRDRNRCAFAARATESREKRSVHEKPDLREQHQGARMHIGHRKEKRRRAKRPGGDLRAAMPVGRAAIRGRDIAAAAGRRIRIQPAPSGGPGPFTIRRPPRSSQPGEKRNGADRGPTAATPMIAAQNFGRRSVRG